MLFEWRETYANVNGIRVKLSTFLLLYILSLAIHPYHKNLPYYIKNEMLFSCLQHMARWVNNAKNHNWYSSHLICPFLGSRKLLSCGHYVSFFYTWTVFNQPFNGRTLNSFLSFEQPWRLVPKAKAHFSIHQHDQINFVENSFSDSYLSQL